MSINLVVHQMPRSKEGDDDAFMGIRVCAGSENVKIDEDNKNKPEKEEEKEERDQAQQQYEECAICMEPLGAHTDIKYASNQALTICAHRFHLECMMQYIIYHASDPIIYCPICRGVLIRQSRQTSQTSQTSQLSHRVTHTGRERNNRGSPLSDSQQGLIKNTTCGIIIISFWMGLFVMMIVYRLLV
jgi:hypothetical protein